MKQYGIRELKNHFTKLDEYIEHALRKGFVIMEEVLSEENSDILSEKLERIYKIQLEEFPYLKEINEEDVVRCPLYYDEKFVDLIINPKILEILTKMLGENFILHLQNGVINRPLKEHHQVAWHRDLPYQEYTTSKPISINVFYCLSPFTLETGATKILPYSHLFDDFPSIEFAEKNAVSVSAKKGDVIIFNSWLYHKAGHNVSTINRYGINHVYTVPIIKQQIDLPSLLKEKYSEHPLLHKILGYKFATPKSVLELRQNYFKKKQNL